MQRFSACFIVLAFYLSTSTALSAPPNQVDRASLESEAGRNDSALTLLDNWLATHPDDQRALILRADAHIYLRHFSQAKKDIDRALSLNPKSAPAHTAYARYLAASGRPQLAVQECDLALKADPKYINAIAERGRVCTTFNRPEQAIKEYNRALSLDPTNQVALHYRGRHYTSYGKYALAQNDFDRLLKMKTKNPTILFDAAYNLNKCKKYKRAIKIADQAIAINPYFAALYSAKAVAYYLTKDIDNALKTIETGLTRVANNASLHFNRGCLLGELGRDDEAMKEYKQAIRLDHRFSKAHNNLGNLYKKRGMLQEATREFDLSIAFKPDHTLAYRNRAEVSLQSGDFEGAIFDVAQADNFSLQKLGSGKTAEALRSSYKELARQYDRLIEKAPHSFDLIYNRAICHLTFGNNELALADFERFLKEKNWSGTASIHATIYGSLAARLSGRRDKATLLLKELESRSLERGWPYPMVEYLMGRTSLQALSNYGVPRDGKMTMRCVVGLNQYASGDTESAVKSLNSALELARQNADEHYLCVMKLDELAGRRPLSAKPK